MKPIEQYLSNIGFLWEQSQRGEEQDDDILAECDKLWYQLNPEEIERVHILINSLLENFVDIQFIRGDLLSATEGLILHGTNCSGGFGSGVAGAIRKKWPVVCEEFHKQGTGNQLLGQFHPVSVGPNLTVGNCYTQEHFGGDGRKYASASAISTALAKAYDWAEQNRITTVSLPKIGCGLGGLDWDTDVQNVVLAVAARYPSIKTRIYEL